MTAKVTIITPTYNKPTYFAECARSVLAQTYQDWVWWVVLNCWCWPDAYEQSTIWADNRIVPIWFPVTEGLERQYSHTPARIVNWLYPKVQTPYIYFLADDDLIDREGLEKLVEELDVPFGVAYNADAVYGRMEVKDEQPDGTFKHACWCYEGSDVGGDTSIKPDCLLDGGQVLHTKALWEKATADGWKLPDDKANAAHNDGILLNRLSQFATFHYVPQQIATHRRTKQSSFHKPQ